VTSVSASTPTSNRVAPGALGRVKRAIGTYQRRLGVRVGCGLHGDTDAQSDPGRSSGELQGIQRNLKPKALSQCLSFIDGRVGKQHREFLAPGAAEDISQSRVSVDHLCNMAQHGVASGVTLGVIDILEVIQSDRQHTALQRRVPP